MVIMQDNHFIQSSPLTQDTSTNGNNVDSLHVRIPSDHSVNGLYNADTSDDNEIAPEQLDDATSIHSDVDASSLIGVSIGHVQTAMKSPTTPATTKAQALEESMTYFASESDGQIHQFQEPLSKESTTPPVQATIDSSTPAPSQKQDSTTSEDNQKHSRHSSLVGSFLRAAGSTSSSRQRSSSGSMWLESIRKLLPGFSSTTQSVPENTDRSGIDRNGSKVLGPAGPGVARTDNVTVPDLQKAPEKETSIAELAKEPVLAPAASDPSHAESIVGAQSARPQPLRRVTSDQSLYIRRAPTGASQFDDYNNFADVSEMVNSRFKAITDSFQDSAIRLPKLPSVGWGDRDTADTKLSDSTSHNTKANTGLSRMDTLAATRNEDRVPSEKTNPAPNIKSSRHPIIKGALARMHGDLVIMGGYRGSILREAQAPNRQLWVPVKVGLNLRKADLEVGLNREDELKMEKTIIPDGTLSHIGPVDICRRLLKKCRRCPNVKSDKLRIHDYGYDWRLSPDLLADRYIAFLESLPCNGRSVPVKERGAWVIAHSLGGLITRNVVNRRPDLFAGVVFAGTPQNCVNILGPLRNGDDVLFSSRVLTAQVNFTLRTSYALLPQDGRCFINKKTGERYDVNFFDVKSWEEYHLSPCIRAPLHRPKVENKRHSILGATTSSDSHTSISSRYNSWLGTMPKQDSEADPTNDKSTSQLNLKDKAVQAKDEIADKAEQAAEAKVPETSPFSPSMADTQHQSQRPSIATTVTIPLPAATAYLDRTLSSVLKFKRSLAHNPDIQARNAYPPSAILFAKNTPTVYGAFVESREAIKYDDAFDDLAFAAGDGVVLASAAQLPPGYRCVTNGRVESERGHVGLLGDLEGIGKCLAAIVEARRKGVGSDAHAEDVDRGKLVM